jgi:predicted PurR-regulated permease PerM
MKASAAILNPFFLAVFISIIASQPAAWLYHKGIPKSISIIIVMLIIISIGVLIGGLIGGSIGQLTQDLPALELNFKTSLSEFISKLNTAGIQVSSKKIQDFVDPAKIMGYLASTINGMGSMLGQIIIILLIAVFMLFELDNFPTKYNIITNGEKAKTNYNFALIIHNVRSYLGIKTLTSMATGIIIVIGLKLIGIQYALFWGLLAFLMNYIPNIGSLLAAFAALLFAMIENGLGGVFWTAGLYAFVNLIIGSIIEPKLMGDGLGLSTLVVLLSLIFWGWVFGPIGMFLSVPFTMALKIILETNDRSQWLSVILDSEQNTNKQWNEIKNKKIEDE